MSIKEVLVCGTTLKYLKSAIAAEKAGDDSDMNLHMNAALGHEINHLIKNGVSKTGETDPKVIRDTLAELAVVISTGRVIVEMTIPAHGGSNGPVH